MKVGSSRARITTLGLACALIASCSAISPRPDTTSTAPPLPSGTTPLGHVTWTPVATPLGLVPEGIVNDAAARSDSFVLVGDTGAPVFRAVVFRSEDGRSWDQVQDEDVAPWGLSKVIATDSGYVAAGGRFSETLADGSVGWASALLTSADGRDWTVRQTFDGMDIIAIAAHGSTVVAVADSPIVLLSTDGGATWRDERARNLGFRAGSPTALGVLSSGRWVALGTSGPSAAAWFSDDAVTWQGATIDAADPVRGVKAVEPYAIAAGSFAAVGAGNEVPENCAEDDDFCGRYGTGWSTMDGTHWMRLPRGTPLTDGWGIRIWPAGAAGVVANLPKFAQSPTGWSWSTVPGADDNMLIDVLAIRGPTVVAFGVLTSRDDSNPPIRSIWVGSIADR